MLDPVPRRYTVCSHLFLPRCHRPSPSEEWVGFPRFVPRIRTSRRPVFRGCRYSLMFRPPSLLSPQIVPTAAILPQGSRGFYVRAYRALLPPHAPDMLTVRIQVIDGTGTFTLSDSQPCRLLTSLHGRYSISSLLRPIRHPLAFDRFPGLAGYTIYLAPVISPRDEEGFASYSVCPCYRAVAFTPPRWRCRIGQISAPHAAFALRKQARPSDLRLSRPHLRSLSLRPGNS